MREREKKKICRETRDPLYRCVRVLHSHPLSRRHGAELVCCLFEAHDGQHDAGDEEEGAHERQQQQAPHRERVRPHHAPWPHTAVAQNASVHRRPHADVLFAHCVREMPMTSRSNRGRWSVHDNVTSVLSAAASMTSEQRQGTNSGDVTMCPHRSAQWSWQFNTSERGSWCGEQSVVVSLGAGVSHSATRRPLGLSAHSHWTPVLILLPHLKSKKKNLTFKSSGSTWVSVIFIKACTAMINWKTL